MFTSCATSSLSIVALRHRVREPERTLHYLGADGGVPQALALSTTINIGYSAPWPSGCSAQQWRSSDDSEEVQINENETSKQSGTKIIGISGSCGGTWNVIGLGNEPAGLGAHSGSCPPKRGSAAVWGGECKQPSHPVTAYPHTHTHI